MSRANDVEEEAAREGAEEEDQSQPLSSVPINNRKWLKGVALKKVQVSGTRRSSVDSAESAQPYLSMYERDGLLALIQEMLGKELFILDTPHTCPNPKQLLEELSEQLQCSNVERMCAPRPTGVGLIPAPLVSRGSDHVGSRKKGGSSATGGTPRKRGRKIDEDSTKSVKVQKKDDKTSKRKVASKRKRKPLLVSLPKSLMKGTLGGEREEISQNGRQGVGEVSLSEVAVIGNSEVIPNKTEQAIVKDEQCFEVIGVEPEQQVNVEQILTPPMSLSSASADSISPSPSPSPIPPSSPLTPSSHPFTLKLELDSPISSCATPLSQTTPTVQSTTPLLSQQTSKDLSETVSIESPMATSDSVSE